MSNIQLREIDPFDELRYALSENISFLRKHLKLEQKDIERASEELGSQYRVSQKTISELERLDTCTPTTKTLCKLFKTIQVNWIPELELAHLVSKDGIRKLLLKENTQSTDSYEYIDPEVHIKATDSILSKARRLGWLTFNRGDVSSPMLSDLISDEYNKNFAKK
ncbi:hypothetical protein [Algicola sagamiensis]|uniref:hypothetical protein n=1 Tax=Algicola sagamiensis TaxID=163869 RepID=UPI000360F3A7|nr:hypothetical protein [Algicola sagamiensis]